MTFWLDAQLHPELAPWLGWRFRVVVQTLKEIGLRQAADHVVFEAARRFREIVVVTKDEDFVELVEQRGAPPQVLWLTTGNATKMELQAILNVAFARALEQLRAGAPVVEISR